MNKENNFQERYFVSLDNSKEGAVARKILESPNNLAIELIKILFENKFNSIKLDLDSIKKFVAGITRAESHSSNYSLANYYGYLFSFHQFFHSSYRARQGKALEALLNQILKECGSSFVVADKTNEKIVLEKEIFPKMESKLDLDAVCRKNNNEYLVVQLRSRDDTGGTTAKGSLVDFLRKSYEWEMGEDKKLLYLVAIWDGIVGNQKKITKDKIFESLSHIIKDRFTKEEFSKQVENGIKVRDNIILKLVYGTDNLALTLGEWSSPEAEIDAESIKNMIIKIESWDDLWLSYAMVSLELDNQKISGNNNVETLNSLLKTGDIKALLSSTDVIESANNLSLTIALKWTEDSIPVKSPSEKIHYIRDLILLRCIYETPKS